MSCFLFEKPPFIPDLHKQNPWLWLSVGSQTLQRKRLTLHAIWNISDAWTYLSIFLRVKLEVNEKSLYSYFTDRLDRWLPIIILENRASADVLSRNL